MPIVNGQYVSPTWQNGGPPALEEIELQAITDTLENLDAGGGSGGGDGKRYARFVIGTSTNGWTAADCDYLCDGTSDDVEIQAAINALPQSGGEIVILSGNYNLSNPLSFQLGASSSNPFSLTVCGNGASTNLVFPSIESVNGVSAYQNISFIHLSAQNFYLNGANSTSTVCAKNCYFLNSKIQCASGNCLISGNIFFITQAVTGPIIYIQGGTNLQGGSFYSIFANNCIQLSGSGSSSTIITVRSSSAIGNTIYGNGGTGISAGNNSSISENILYNCNLSGGFLDSFSGNTIVNGYIFAQESTVSGNCISNGYIQCSEGSSVCGNVVYQESPTGDGCVIVKKARNNQSSTAYTVISGNTCDGGTVGILLDTNTFSNSAESNATITGNACSSTSPMVIQNVWSNCLITGNMFPNGTITDNGSGNIKANNFTAS